MPIIFISSLPFGNGDKLARNLARKLGYSYLNREDVVARANECGIPVGKLEVAMVKKPAVMERLARLKDRYLAVATAAICEKASRENLVYSGRAGHHLLPGVAHVVRVHIVPDLQQRIENVMQRLRLDREKSETFLQNVDADIRAWVRFVHGVEIDDVRKYDFVLNLENLSIENAAAALCGIAQLPDFSPTPASLKAMEDRLLQSRARIKLALDERSANADLTVRSNDGILTITYMPRQAQVAGSIPGILSDLPNCLQIRCTMASTNILWIQEEFRTDSEAFRHVGELARRLGAAVELLRFAPDGAQNHPEITASDAVSRKYTGGVEDDVPLGDAPAGRSFQEALDAFVHEGRSGGGQTISGPREKLLSAINPGITYSLVTVGDLFLNKAPGARMRMTRELCNYLSQNIRAPVVSTADLGKKLKFGIDQILGLAASLILVAVVYVLLFQHQEAILNVIAGGYHTERPWVSPVLITLIAPLVAGVYGFVAASLLKIFKFE